MRLVSFGVCVTLVLSFGCGVPVDDASSSTADQIIGGTNTSAVPAVGAITFDGDPYCTGTLIGPRQILTAAHCLEEAAASDLQFLTGMTVRRPTGVYDCAELVMHPDYDPDTLENDIAYIILDRDAEVDPIGLVPRMSRSWEGSVLLFMGYGVNNGRQQTGDGIKRKVEITIDSVEAGTFTFGDSEANICDGDSGGPSLDEEDDGSFLVAGVTSAGDRSCRRFGIHTRVDQHLEFLADADPCQGETYYGRCDGDVLIWCEDGAAWEYDCADEALGCGLLEDGYDCVE